MKKQIIVLFLLLLFIQVASFAKDYKGAEYRTKESFIYGRFEARYKPPKGDGFLASFFTYHEITSQSAWNEIDFEILGRYDHDVQVTSIGPGQKIRNSHQWVEFNTHEDFHNYAFEWTPDYIAWFIDDNEVYRQTQEHIAEFKYDQKIMMNIWPPTWEPWAGKLDDRVLPVFAYYDWVSYASYTPDSGNTGTDNNFTLQWKDEFESWDQSRWEKATHTFGGNNCDFASENVVFKDGVMILCLTKTSPLGYMDQSPPAVLWTRTLKNTIQILFSEAVEQTSAEQKSNYLISGVTISDAKLLSDRRTVVLAVSDLNPLNSYSLIVLGIKDDAANHNLMTGQVVPLNVSQPLSFPVKINVGGKAYGDYLADQVWTPALEYSHQDGYVTEWPSTINIIGVEDDVIYLSELQEVVKYKIRVPDGDYKVTLMIAENKFEEIGKRIFDIVVEDQRIVGGLDLVQQVGAHTAYQVVADNIEINDEMIDIHFNNLWNFSLLNGIIIEQVDTDVNDREAHPIPNRFQLFQNYPNPFNSATTFSYDLPSDGFLTLTVYNLQGQKVSQLIDKAEQAGKHQITWHADVTTGIYFYHIDFLTSDHRFSECRKMILMR